MNRAHGAEPNIYQQEVGGISLNIIELPYGSQAKVGLADDGVGFTEELADIAIREGASVAINGSFFEAYGGKPEANNNLISGGKVVHIGDVGTTIGFFPNGSIKMEALQMKIEGASNGSYEGTNHWYAWGMNHMPGATGSYIYTPEYGEHIGFSRGISVVVSGGRVTDKVVDEDVQIPEDGYVINFVGDEEYQGDVFSVGTKVDYRITKHADQNWEHVVEGLSAGPKLISDGDVAVHAIQEGFTEGKITDWSSMRSAIAVMDDGMIMLVTSPSATINQLATAMTELGAVEAMNLDGGASSCLWANGEYITPPGRAISNALLFFLP